MLVVWIWLEEKVLSKDDLSNIEYLMETPYLLRYVHLSFCYILIMNLIITDHESFINSEIKVPIAFFLCSSVINIPPSGLVLLPFHLSFVQQMFELVVE